MGWSGASPLPRDLSVLTPREREIYEWACRTWEAKVYPSDGRCAEAFGYRSRSYPSRLMKSIRSKVGWMCPLFGRPSGTHGLTPDQRKILTMAWDLWERKPREEPTLEAIRREMGFRGSSSQLKEVRDICIQKEIWPCKVKPCPAELTPEERNYVIHLKKNQCPYVEIPDRFRERFNRGISSRTVYRILKPTGLMRVYRAQRVESYEERKLRVIGERGGKSPSRMDEPAAYRRVLRASRRARASSQSG